MADQLMDVSDVAKRLNVHERTVYNYIKRGWIKGVQFGGKGRPWKFKESDIQAFIEDEYTFKYKS